MTSERDPTSWVSKKPRQPVKRGASHDPIHTYGRLMCWRRHGTQLTPLGQTLHSTSNAFAKAGAVEAIDVSWPKNPGRITWQ